MGYVIIPHDGDPRIVNQLGFITMGSNGADGDEQIESFIRDSEGNFLLPETRFSH